MYMEKLIGEALLVMVRNGLTTEDYEFEGNCLYLNFEPPMDAAGYIYDSAMVRQFIDAVNFLLGMNKYIVSYAIY